MYCSNCGKKVEDTDVFCGGCGNQLKGGGTNQVKAEKSTMEEQIKAFGNVIIYIVLLLAFCFFSRANLFDFAFEEVTLTRFLDKIIYLLNMSQELDGLKVFCQICLWVFRIGLFTYLGAAVFVFMNRNREARICAVVGFICNLVVIMAILLGILLCADELAGLLYMGGDDVFGFIKKCLKESFYLYVVLNAALLVCGLRFSDAEENVEMKLSEKDKALIGLANSNLKTTCDELNTNFKTTYDSTVGNEGYISDGQLVIIGSLLGGTLFNLIVAFIAGSSEFMKWGIKHSCFTYIIALVFCGILDCILNGLTRKS